MNAAEHRLSSAMVMGSLAASMTKKPEDTVVNTVTACAGGYYFATLPDLVEPATDPHHRQFFHSVLFAAALGYGLYKVYRWETQSPLEEFARKLALVVGGAYLVHLAVDATTKRSLPLVGRL